MEINEYFLSLIVVWNNPKEKKIVRYELYVGKCYAKEPYKIKSGEKEGETIELPLCNAVISNLKLTKTQAKELMGRGYKVGAAYCNSYPKV